MNTSKIEWCKYTWNPVTGCSHGCPYCYAAKIAHRFTKTDAECGNCSICPDCPGKTSDGKCPDFREYRPRERIHAIDTKQYGFYPKKHYIAFPYGTGCKSRGKSKRRQKSLYAAWRTCSGIPSRTNGFLRFSKRVRRIRNIYICSLQKIPGDTRIYWPPESCPNLKICGTERP